MDKVNNDNRGYMSEKEIGAHRQSKLPGADKRKPIHSINRTQVHSCSVRLKVRTPGFGRRALLHECLRMTLAEESFVTLVCYLGVIAAVYVNVLIFAIRMEAHQAPVEVPVVADWLPPQRRGSSPLGIGYRLRRLGSQR